MNDLIRSLVLRTLVWLLPPPKGRHARPRVQLPAPARSVAAPEPAARPVPARPVVSLPHCARVPWPQVAYPSDRAREQRRRRTALMLATWGIDVGPRRIHGVRVGSPAVAR